MNPDKTQVLEISASARNGASASRQLTRDLIAALARED